MSDFLKLFDKSTVRGRLFHLINDMTSEQQTALLAKAEELIKPTGQHDLRKSPRELCATTAYIACKHRILKHVATDISDGGAFIETQEPLLIGQTILLSVKGPGNKKPVQVTGEVVWKNSRGIGVKFVF